MNINSVFRKNHSTSHAIITLVERVTKALDTGKYVVHRPKKGLRHH